VNQRKFNHYICQLLLTMLERNPEEGELDEVKRELRSLMAKWQPSLPPRPRAAQPPLEGTEEEVF